MRVLVGCEESQVICKAFRSLGHEAFSCDVQPCSGGCPSWHIQDDVFSVLSSSSWDLLIAHPPCTFLTNAASCLLFRKNYVIRDEKRLNLGKLAADFFFRLWSSPVHYICLENPVPVKLFGLPPYSEILQPYEFGENIAKRTCLWLKNLPYLLPTSYFAGVPGHWTDMHRSPVCRARSFPGVASAMARQWGNLPVV